MVDFLIWEAGRLTSNKLEKKEKGHIPRGKLALQRFEGNLEVVGQVHPQTLCVRLLSRIGTSPCATTTHPTRGHGFRNAANECLLASTR
jgi:hypothetical protein